MKRATLVLVLLLLLGSATAYGQATIKIHGKVMDADSQAVAFAAVRVPGLATTQTDKSTADFEMVMRNAALATTKFYHKGTKDTKKKSTGVAFVSFVPLWCKNFAAMIVFSRVILYQPDESQPNRRS